MGSGKVEEKGLEMVFHNIVCLMSREKRELRTEGQPRSVTLQEQSQVYRRGSESIVV